MNKIQYHKWDIKEFNKLKKDCKDKLDLKEIQIYQPYFSLYFHLHNTKKSHQYFDLKRNYILKNIYLSDNNKYYTSNSFLNADIYDSKNNVLKKESVFCKSIPLLDPVHFMMNNYNNKVKRNTHLPSCYNYNTMSKINDMNNTAYIDTFFSYISSEITYNDKNPSFPLFYGSVNGIKNSFNYDISEDYDEFKREEWFHKNIKRGLFSIDMYMSDSDSDSDSYSHSDNGSDSHSDSKSSGKMSCSSSEYCSSDGSDISRNDDYIANLKNIPCQQFFIEKLEGTLEDIIDNNFPVEIIKSCIFQVSFALAYLQKKYKFTHNDLHVNNVMYKKTDRQYLYYKFNNIYFKVPTYGYLFKIIDFGRCIFTYHNKLFFNDTFNKHGEAEGQYTKPYNSLLFNSNKEKKEKNIKPNYNFDLCRLAITILDVIDFDKKKDYKEKQLFVNFIYSMTCDKYGKSLYELDDDFNMYISIAKDAEYSLPSYIIQNFIFKDYRVKKSKFPKKSYYCLK
jgi:hypothetical protein